MYKTYCKQLCSQWHCKHDSVLDTFNVWTRELPLFLQFSLSTESMGIWPDFHMNQEANTKFPNVEEQSLCPGWQVQTSLPM